MSDITKKVHKTGNLYDASLLFEEKRQQGHQETKSQISRSDKFLGKLVLGIADIFGPAEEVKRASQRTNESTVDAVTVPEVDSDHPPMPPSA